MKIRVAVTVSRCVRAHASIFSTTLFQVGVGSLAFNTVRMIRFDGIFDPFRAVAVRACARETGAASLGAYDRVCCIQYAVCSMLCVD